MKRPLFELIEIVLLIITSQLTKNFKQTSHLERPRQRYNFKWYHLPPNLTKRARQSPSYAQHHILYEG